MTELDGVRSSAPARFVVDTSNLPTGDDLREVIVQQGYEIAYLRDQSHAQERVRENLEAALVNARTIGAAIGIVMRDKRIAYDPAFALLAKASQRNNRKLRDVADDVLLAGHIDEGH